MPTYIQLVNSTNKGIENIEDSPERAEQNKALIETMGGELKGLYLTFGRYDLVIVCEFPDDKTYAQFALKVASRGTVSAETLKAFPENEFREIIDGLPE